MTVSNVDEMMVGVCILRGAYPHLDLQDLVEDVRQIARLTAQENLGDAETEKAVLEEVAAEEPSRRFLDRGG